MRTLAALGLAASLTACQHAAAATAPAALEVSTDGRRAVWHGQAWTAASGMSFFQRGAELHLVSQLTDQPFDLTAEVGSDGNLKWPADARLQVAAFDIRWRSVPASVSARVSQNQLYPHEDHLHVTHHWDNPDFQALYRAREDPSLPPMRRQVAKAMMALVVEEKLPADGDASATAGLARMERILAKMHRGFVAGLPAAALADMLAHDFEIREDGRLLEVEGKLFRAGNGVRFAYCAGHFHVEDALSRWAHPVEFGEWVGTLTFPESPLFTARPDGTVVALPGPRQWRLLLDSGQIQMLRDHWHITATFADPSLGKLRAAADDPKRSEEARSKARDALFELMRLRLELKDEAGFDASVATLREAAARAWRSVEEARPAKK